MNAWVGEIFTSWVTECGAIQTNDTGQISVSGGNANIAALPTGTGVGNAVGFFCLTYNDTLAKGTLSTTALNSGGTGYDAGGTHTYTGVTATGSTSGATCTCTVVVTSGVCGNMSSIAAAGNFIAGEAITIPNSSLGGSGSGASWTATALSSGAPVVVRFDVGGGSATTDPQMWVTVGAGTNGAGVVTGTAGTSKMTQVACFGGGAPVSTVTSYTSRYVYNSMYGYLGMSFKQGAAGAGISGAAFGGLVLFRTNDNGGNAIANAICLITSSNTTTGNATSTCGVMQCMTWSNGAGSTVYPTLSSTNSILWATLPGTASFIFGLTTTLENSTAFITPIYTIDPSIRFSAYNGVGLLNDFPLGNTASYAMIGSTALTFISVGCPFGSTNGEFAGNTGGVNFTFCMLWQ